MNGALDRLHDALVCISAARDALEEAQEAARDDTATYTAVRGVYTDLRMLDMDLRNVVQVVTAEQFEF